MNKNLFGHSPSFLSLAAISTLSFSALLMAESPPVIAPPEKKAPAQLSGIYPSLTMFNNEGECGTGAVVPWADRLWVVTYAPHKPKGSSDKLYEITPDLQQIIRPESIGGTPANRMIHPESKQLFIGPYIIDDKRKVRTIPYTAMFGRHTGNARHLTQPDKKMLFATMEEGIYEVDVNTLKVTELWGDEQKKSPRKANLPGYHGKGFYSGQGVYIYSNNGEHGRAAMTRPEVPSGVLAEWDGKSDKWKVVRRNQFTEITSQGGIYGSKNPAADPIWAMGWDYKSLILGVRTPKAGWSFYRLPKSSHSYDGAHGWNTEWPRIREIGEGDNMLMTMHGAFWKFPKNFSPKNSAGIAPRSNYLKVIGDFCRWNDHVVMGCDDTAKKEFLNNRRAKGHIAGAQSQSNLWFVKPSQLDNLGPVIGRGTVWENEPVTSNTSSDPFLFSGYDHRAMHINHNSPKDVTFTLEIDKKGNGEWSTLKTITVPAKSYQFIPFTEAETGAWIRIKSDTDIPNITAAFTYRNNDDRKTTNHSIFDKLAKNTDLTGGILRARDGNKRTLSFAAVNSTGEDIGYYEMGDDLKLNKVENPAAHKFTQKNAAIVTAALTADKASAIYTDEQDRTWRLPIGELDKTHPLGSSRIAREVATERDLLNAYGTFYELPARNAGGIAKLRAVSTHDSYVHDYCSYRGLFIMSGIEIGDTPNKHIITSGDGKTAVWAGAIDDIWKLGKPRGKGGPWLDTQVKANTTSDPYLMTGFDKKSLTLKATKATQITAQIDITGTGNWVNYKTFKLQDGGIVKHNFPAEFQAYWIRFISEKSSEVSAQLIYQ